MSNIPLTQRLESLQSFKNTGKQLGFILSEKELKDAEVKVLKDFYDENPLAYDIATGKDSYQNRIKPIEEKYNTYWKSITRPKKDEAFDKEVVRVLHSMFGVGCMTSCDPSVFKTEERREYIWKQDRNPLIVSGIMTVAMGICVYNLSDGMLINPLFDAFIRYSPVAGPTLYGITKLSDNQNLRWGLNRLKDDAQKTDEFLKKHCI